MLLEKDIKALIELHCRRVQKLKEQQARMGINTPPEILLEIEDIECEVKKLQIDLKNPPETQPDSGHVITSYIQLNFKGSYLDKQDDFIDGIVTLLKIPRHSITILHLHSSLMIIEMPAEAAIKLVGMFTSKSTELGALVFEFSIEDIKILTSAQRESHDAHEAQKLITAQCLIAADVDKTLIDQLEERETERRTFRNKIAPRLIDAARMGTHIAAITGNSMDQLSSRFFRWVIGELWNDRDLLPLTNFHLFCNSGGIYVNVHPNDEVFQHVAQNVSRQAITREELIDELTITDPNRDTTSIHPRFIDTTYIKQTAIAEQDVPKLVHILGDIATRFQRKLVEDIDAYRKDYLINTPNPLDPSPTNNGDGILYKLFDDNGRPIMPTIDTRPVFYGQVEPLEQVSVQITISPVLSFRHARTPVELFGRDFRNELTQAVQTELDRQGLGRYVARPGGRTSIDVTLEKVDKAYAIEFLIDRLNLQGSARRGLEFGSNAIYFGDEVIVGDGNDYSVTRIPGLLVFAVNKDRDLVPSLSRVFVPSAIFDGPIAVAKELEKYIAESERLIKEYCLSKSVGKPPVIKTAIEALKERIFVERIKDKIDHWDISSGHTSPKDLELMHILVTLLCRDDPVAHQWLTILVDELNAIMTHLEESSKRDVSTLIKAIGHSHAN